MSDASMVKSAVFHVSGMSSYADSLKKLARLNPDWNLTPDQVLDDDKAGQKIYRLRFTTKPVQIQQDPISGSLDVYVADCPIGYIRSDEASQAQNILDHCDIESISCGIWGGQFRIVDEQFDVETGKQGISATVRIKYRDISAPSEDNLDDALFFEEPPKPMKSGQKAKKAKKEKKKKKPFYKRWWFWAIIVFLLIGMAGGGETETETPTIPPTIPTVSADTASLSETEGIPQETTSPETASLEAISPADNISMGQKNALRSAQNYLSFTAFSYSGLIEQLEFEGYSTEDSTYAVDNCGADWFEQALKSAKHYLSFTAFSYTGLIEQLEFEGFTSEQATYGADNCNADWFEQAAKSAENYLSFTSLSRDGLIDQLEFEGFTNEQAVYGAEQNGY